MAADLINRENVWVIECRGSAGLLNKPTYAIFFMGYVMMKYLERYRP